LLSEWVLSPSSPAERRLSPSKPRGLGCRRSGSSVRPARHHPLQLQRVEAPSRPRRPGCTPCAASGRPCGVTRRLIKPVG